MTGDVDEAPAAAEAERPTGRERELVLQLDQTMPGWLTCVGRKGSGKSYLAQRFWDGYQGDKLVIDPTGDVDAGDDVENLTLPLPASLPKRRDDGKPRVWRFVPDPSNDTWRDDMDRCVGLAFGLGRCLLWIDEVGEITRANSTPPHMRQCLRQFRHRDMWVVTCDPRPVDVDPLVISQADYIAAFDLPHPRDRERLAAVMGLAPKDVDAAHELIDRPDEHSSDKRRWSGYLWFDSIRRQLTIMPPLPARRRPQGRRFANEPLGAERAEIMP